MSETEALVSGMRTAVEIMRQLATDPSFAILRGNVALEVVAAAIERAAAKREAKNA